MIQILPKKIPQHYTSSIDFKKIYDEVKCSKRTFIKDSLNFFDKFSEFTGIPVGFTKKELFKLFLHGIKDFSNIKEKSIKNDKAVEKKFNLVDYFERNYVQNLKDVIPIFKEDKIENKISFDELKSKILTEDIIKYEENENSFVAISEDKLYVSGINQIVGPFGSLGINSYNRKSSQLIKDIVSKDCNNLEGFYDDVSKFDKDIMYFYEDNPDTFSISEVMEDFKHNYIRYAEIPIPNEYRILDMWYFGNVIVLKLEVKDNKDVKYLFSSPFFIENGEIYDLSYDYNLLQNDYILNIDHGYPPQYDVTEMFKNKTVDPEQMDDEFLFQKFIKMRKKQKNDNYSYEFLSFSTFFQKIFKDESWDLEEKDVSKQLMRASYEKVKKYLNKNDLTFKDIFETNYCIIKDGSVFDGWCDLTNMFKFKKAVSMQNVFNDRYADFLFGSEHAILIEDNDKIKIELIKIDRKEYNDCVIALILNIKDFYKNITYMDKFYKHDNNNNNKRILQFFYFLNKTEKIDIDYENIYTKIKLNEFFKDDMRGIDIAKESIKISMNNLFGDFYYIKYKGFPNISELEISNFLQNIVFLNMCPSIYNPPPPENEGLDM